MERLIQVLDLFSDRMGRLASMVMLPVLLVTFAVVVLRYVFGIGLIWLQDSYVWLTSVFFICMAGNTFLHDRHVRVELFYSRMTARKRALVNALGVLLLLWPTLFVTVQQSWRPIARSWRFLEALPNAGGLSFAYVHKSLVYVFCLVLFLQGLSLLLKSARTLAGARGVAPEASP
ncbi:TRAP transporter small permease subunit [Bordetella parapertussis]|uniref:TRAP transporter small permease protein n=2 Tax=Bordetella parapertussis TaxID=519 RepID=Q7W1I9_BORPA|nr:TRAP transporter small permease subunit [Bordetella parapertussis]AOB38010.1 hypothetical protein BBB43_03470 [Bordetella parapertussis]AUL41983.1 hypothetical protein BTL54_03535 [Bordetella parapertussis]AWP61898.1 hypothetical protein B7P06_03545 [Bordetella parapertussis]AWP69395.1 hypothetical protein B7O99_03540 [Bordetella parapertussis]AWP87987.1 hypothetical protein B7P05_03535 [Bordetella parapertussis]